MLSKKEDFQCQEHFTKVKRTGITVFSQMKAMADMLRRWNLGLTLGRVHINSCDFSLGNYCFDPVEEDYELDHFDMQEPLHMKFILVVA